MLINKYRSKFQTQRLLSKSLFNRSFMNNNKLKKRNTGNGRSVVYKKGVVNLHKEAKVNIEKGIFTFNCKWDEIEPFYSYLVIRKGAVLNVKNNFRIFSNSRVYVNEGATLTLGSGYINNNLNLSCFDSIWIGENVAISENVTIRDSDNHQLLNQDHVVTQPVRIKDKVWLGINVTILKGVTIGYGSVIGAGSVVVSDIPANCLAVGVPAKVIKKNIEWV